MSKLKVLVPLDGSEKSMHSLDWLKKFYSSEDCGGHPSECDGGSLQSGNARVSKTSRLKLPKERSADTLEAAETLLEGYTVKQAFCFRLKR